MFKLHRGLALAAGLGCATPAVAVPVAFEGNYYEYVPGLISRTDAAAAVASRTFDPGDGLLQGYLATITSAGEHNFLRSLSGLSGWVSGSDIETEGIWQWTDGPEAGQVYSNGGSSVGGAYVNWGPGEPNNLEGVEHFMHIADAGGWNDLAADQNTHGYFVEYGGILVDTPEPSSMLSLLAAFAGLAIVKVSTSFSRRRRHAR